MSKTQGTEYNQEWICKHFDQPDRQFAMNLVPGLTKFEGAWMPFSQRRYLKGDTLYSDGICSALSVMFLGYTNEGKKDFFGYIGTEEGRQQVMNTCAVQNSQNGWAELHLEKCGLKRRYQRAGDTIEQIQELVKVDGLYDLSLSDLSGKFKTTKAFIKALDKLEGHALAMIVTDVSAALFDPNFGLFLFQSKDKMGSFMKGVCKNIYPGLNGSTSLARYSS